MTDALREMGKRTRAIKPKLTDEEKQEALNYVSSLVSIYVPLHQNELIALVSFVLTTRKGALARSLMLKYLNNGQKLKAANEMIKPQWYTVRGTKKGYLKKLRESQRKAFLTPVIIGGKDGEQVH
jgi:GH24 family phage-related lysozyme (muramidase)